MRWQTGKMRFQQALSPVQIEIDDPVEQFVANVGAEVAQTCDCVWRIHREPLEKQTAAKEKKQQQATSYRDVGTNSIAGSGGFATAISEFLQIDVLPTDSAGFITEIRPYGINQTRQNVLRVD